MRRDDELWWRADPLRGARWAMNAIVTGSAGLTARFLPYTSKSRLTRAPRSVATYLAFPIAWRVVGGQMLLVRAKPGAGTD